MQIRSFIIAFALVLAILVFADRRPNSDQQDRYSRVVDLTDGLSGGGQTAPLQPGSVRKLLTQSPAPTESRTRIVAPDALIPGTWTAGQIPPERLIAPLIVMDLSAPAGTRSQISLDEIAAWEAQHGAIPQGSVVAIRGGTAGSERPVFPVTSQAAQFLMDARYTTGFVTEISSDFESDRTMARQIALHGNYVVESTVRLSALPPTGSLIIVAPAKKKDSGRAAVRVLAMVR